MERLVEFHEDVYLPDLAKAPVYKGVLNYSRHAQNVAAGLSLPKEFPVPGAVLIEAEIELNQEKVTKQVWRMPLSADNDLVMVVDAQGLVRTVWLNHPSDKHDTLRKSRYMSGFAWRCRHKAPKQRM